MTPRPPGDPATGRPTPRVDGRAKVTGEARYAADVPAPGLAHGAVVQAGPARGKIRAIDARAALAVPGVLQVFTHENAPRLAWLDRSWRDEIAPAGSPFRPLQADRVQFAGQPVALVVAEEYEVARHAATLVRVEVEEEPHATALEWRPEAAHEPRKGKAGYTGAPPPRGDADAALASAHARVEAEYLQPVEHHNPMEPFATTVVWSDDGSLVVHDKTQGVANVEAYLRSVFGFKKGQVRVVSPFVGGAFGSGLRPQMQVVLAVLAARALRRSVRVVLTRRQMFAVAHRPAVRQRLAVGAARDGRLLAIVHEAISETSRHEDFCDNVVVWSSLLYECANVRSWHRVLPLDLPTPIDMRAPGAVPGLFALESAIDELSYACEVDPLEMRLRNHAERDMIEGRPFSSKELRACYAAGAERIGWARRPFAPRSRRIGRELLGLGVATAVWDAGRAPALARARLESGPRLVVECGTSDIGTGTATIMSQLAADALGLPLDAVIFRYADSSLPRAPVEGGSMTAATVGPAVQAACAALGAKLLALAQHREGSPLAGARPEDVRFGEGLVRLASDAARAVTLEDALLAGSGDPVEAEAATAPLDDARSPVSRYSHGAIFAEVRVDEDLGTVRVARICAAIAAGRILNPLTARSQIMGGIVGGIGAALEEETEIDHSLGRFMTADMAEYKVPVHADIPSIEVIFVPEDEGPGEPLGAKGIGEIGITAVAPAIANAVFHATGKRVRALPIRVEKLL